MTVEALESHITRLRERIGQELREVVTKFETGAIQKFARALGETSRLHFDEDYANATRFGASAL